MSADGIYIPIAEGELAPKNWMEFGNAERLGQFTDQYRFFTPALLYMQGRFNDAPLIEFLSGTRKPIHYFHHRFVRPIFKGIETSTGNDDWNYVLWAIEAYAWPEFESFMLSVMMWDPRVKVAYQVAAKDLSIVDPLLMDKTATLPPRPPRLNVVGFGVDSSLFALSFIDGPPPFSMPTVKFYPALDRAKQTAKALAAGENPNLHVPFKPLALTPVDFQVRDITQVNSVRRADYLRSIEQYKKENPS